MNVWERNGTGAPLDRKSVRYGMYLPIEGPFSDVDLLVELAVSAEAAGWDGVFLWDELLPIADHSDAIRRALGMSRDMADAWVALTAIAAATSRIRLGPLVSPVARHRPESFARLTATLDRLSGGRLTIGVGLGAPDEQFTSFGLSADPKVRAAMLDELLEVVAAFWTGEEVDVSGEHFAVHGVALRPTPAQQPRIPIWIGGGEASHGPRRRAARWDGFAPASDGWPDEVISAAAYRAIAEEVRAHRGSDEPFDLVVIGNGSGSSPAPSEVPDYEDDGVTWLLVQALGADEARSHAAAGPPTG